MYRTLNLILATTCVLVLGCSNTTVHERQPPIAAEKSNGVRIALADDVKVDHDRREVSRASAAPSGASATNPLTLTPQSLAVCTQYPNTYGVCKPGYCRNVATNCCIDCR